MGGVRMTENDGGGGGRAVVYECRRNSTTASKESWEMKVLFPRQARGVHSRRRIQRICKRANTKMDSPVFRFVYITRNPM